MTRDPVSDALPRFRIVSKLLHRPEGFVEAAEALAELATHEGYRVVGVHALTEALADTETAEAWPDVPPALVLEIDHPDLVAAFLAHRPETAVHLPIRLLLVQEGRWIRLTTLDPTFYRDLFDAPNASLERRLSWLEVTLDVLMRALA